MVSGWEENRSHRDWVVYLFLPTEDSAGVLSRGLIGTKKRVSSRMVSGRARGDKRISLSKDNICVTPLG